MGEISKAEALWRKLRGREFVVRTGYKTVYTGRRFREALKENPDVLKKEIFTDNEDYDEILYMMGVHLADPHVKLYITYNDGSTRRIKIGIYRKHHLRNLIRRIFNDSSKISD